jgi:uncharacterized membrane protein
MTMRRYESSADIDAPRETVWRVLADVAAWPEWLPTVTKVEALDGKELRAGARFIVHQPKLRPATWTVSRVSEFEGFVWEARSPGLEMVAEHTIARRLPSGSSIALRFSFGGFLGGLIGRVYGSVTLSYLEQEASALKRKVEGR